MKRAQVEHLQNQFKYAIVPEHMLRRFLVNRSFRCVFCTILAGLMLLPLTVLPGLALVVLPAEVALVGKIHDEAQLVSWARANAIPRRGKWEDADLEAEAARLEAHDRRDSAQSYIR